MAIIAMLVLGLTHLVAALAGRLAEEFGAYQGQWRLGGPHGSAAWRSAVRRTR